MNVVMKIHKNTTKIYAEAGSDRTTLMISHLRYLLYRNPNAVCIIFDNEGILSPEESSKVLGDEYLERVVVLHTSLTSITTSNPDVWKEENERRKNDIISLTNTAYDTMRSSHPNMILMLVSTHDNSITLDDFDDSHKPIHIVTGYQTRRNEEV